MRRSINALRTDRKSRNSAPATVLTRAAAAASSPLGGVEEEISVIAGAARRPRLCARVRHGGHAPPLPTVRSRAVYVLSWAGMDVGELRTEVVEADGGLPRGLGGRYDRTGRHPVPVQLGRAARGSARRRPLSARGLRWPQPLARRRWEWRVAFGVGRPGHEIQMSQAELAEREPVPAAMQVGPDPASLALMAIASRKTGRTPESRQLRRQAGRRLRARPARRLPPAASCLHASRPGCSRARRGDGARAQPRARPNDRRCGCGSSAAHRCRWLLAGAAGGPVARSARSRHG